MRVLKEEVTTYVVDMLTELAEDWGYDEAIDRDTLFFTGLGLQSLDVVVLGNSLQEHYQAIIPYADLLSDLGQREFKDITVGDWVDFTYQELTKSAVGETS